MESSTLYASTPLLDKVYRPAVAVLTDEAQNSKASMTITRK